MQENRKQWDVDIIMQRLEYFSHLDSYEKTRQSEDDKKPIIVLMKMEYSGSENSKKLCRKKIFLQMKDSIKSFRYNHVL